MNNRQFLEQARQPLLPQEMGHTRQNRYLSDPCSTCLGLLFIAFGITTINIQTVLVKFLLLENRRITISQILIVRAAFSLIICYFLAKYHKQSISNFDAEQAKIIFVRFLLTYATVSCTFLSLRFIPLGVSQSIQTLQPQIAIILTAFMMSTRVKIIDKMNTFFSVIGISMCIYFAMKAHDDFPRFYEQYISQYEFTNSILINIMAAICGSLAFMISSGLRNLHYSVSTVLQSLLTLILSLLVEVFNYVYSKNKYNIRWTNENLITLFMIGITTPISQILLAKGLQLDTFGRSACFLILNIILGYAADIYVFEYELYSGELLGAMILSGSLLITYLIKLQ